MNVRHKALYDYLIERGDEWTSQVQIARDLYSYYGNGECCLEPQEYHDTTERTFISKDISDINFNFEFEKMIISSCKGVKIANEKEADKYLVSQYKTALKRLARAYRLAKKCNRHNQIGFNGESINAYLENVEKSIDK